MEEQVLEFNGHKYDRASLIQFGKEHDLSKSFSRIDGILFTALATYVLLSYLLIPVFAYAGWLSNFFPFAFAFMLWGDSFSFLVFVITGILYLIGIPLIIGSFAHRDDDYYLSIAKVCLVEEYSNK